MLRPGSLLSRGLALVVTLGATLGLYEFAVLPLITAHAGTRATIDQATALLQRYHALGEQRARLADQVSENERFVADSGSYLAGRSDVLAAAALYERVGSVLERADGELRSTQVLPAQAAKTGVPLRLTALKIRFIIDIDGLRDALYELETGKPYLFIEELSIQRPDTSNPVSALDVSLTIGGYTEAKQSS